MDHGRTIDRVVTSLAVFALVTLLPACHRPEETPPPVTDAAPRAQPEPPFSTLELPQTNPEIGITVDRAPAGLAATYNGEHWIEFADLSQPALRYVLVPAVADDPAVSPFTVAEFESMVGRYPDGQVGPGGELDTRFGRAAWSSGTYSEDGELLLDVRLFVPHPSGSGVFVVYSHSPADLANVETRLQTMRELLEGVS